MVLRGAGDSTSRKVEDAVRVLDLLLTWSCCVYNPASVPVQGEGGDGAAGKYGGEGRELRCELQSLLLIIYRIGGSCFQRS